MWKYYDEGPRNMGVESSPYYHHAAARAENSYYPSPSQYINGNVAEQTANDWNRRPFDQHHQRFKSPDPRKVIKYNKRPQSSSFIEETPHYKQRRPTEMGITRKRLKLIACNELQQNDELIVGNEDHMNLSNESQTEKLDHKQTAPFLNIELDNETLNNLKKILESNEISAIKSEESPDKQKPSDENESEKLSDLQIESSKKDEESLSDLQEQSSENKTEDMSSLEKIDIPFHKVQLDNATWENLKKITTSPILKTSESSAETSASQDSSLLSQSTKSEILTESSFSQEGSSLAKETPSLAKEIPKLSACSDIAQEKREMPDDPWFLNEKDILNHVNNKTPGSVNRVRKSSLTCHSCGEKGHSSRFCTKVKKLPVCFICGREGHNGDFCRDVICSRCLRTGHPPERCHWFDRENSVCSLCKYLGHYMQDCPDFWRRHHVTTIPGHIVCPPYPLVTNRIFCYNCAEEGHLGHDCEEERIDPYSFPSYPFIVDYSNPYV